MVEGFFESSAGLFKRAGLSPNSVTVLGFVLTLAAFLFYARGLRFAWEQAGAFSTLLIAGYFDAVDGALARRYHAVSKFGGILDSTLDRLGELLLYSALAIGNLVDFRLALWALSASFMVSYVRARAEADGIAMKGVGIAERPERLLILIVSTLLQPFYQVSLAWGTLLVAVLASLTLVERIYRVRSGAFHAPLGTLVVEQATPVVERSAYSGMGIRPMFAGPAGLPRLRGIAGCAVVNHILHEARCIGL